MKHLLTTGQNKLRDSFNSPAGEISSPATILEKASILRKSQPMPATKAIAHGDFSLYYRFNSKQAPSPNLFLPGPFPI
jgi:hypothetical protein